MEFCNLLRLVIMISESIILRRLFVENSRKCKTSRSVFVNVMNMVIPMAELEPAGAPAMTSSAAQLKYDHRELR